MKRTTPAWTYNCDVSAHESTVPKEKTRISLAFSVEPLRRWHARNLAHVAIGLIAARSLAGNPDRGLLAAGPPWPGSPSK